MANTLRIKRRASGDPGSPSTSQCVNAELAFNEVDGILYYGKGGNATASSSVVAIGAELGTGVAAFLKTPSSANLATALTDETGSSTVVFSNSPTLVTPNIGTPSAGTLTNCTGLPISGIASLGSGVATFLATPSSANLATALTDETGSSTVVFSNSPTLVTPNIGTPSAGTLTSCTGLPISTGVSGLGTGVATFLATPSSANFAAALTNETGSNTVVFSTSPAFTTSVTTASTTFAVFDTAATTVNAFGETDTLNIGRRGVSPNAEVNIYLANVSGANTEANVFIGQNAGDSRLTIGNDAASNGGMTVYGQVVCSSAQVNKGGEIFFYSATPNLSTTRFGAVTAATGSYILKLPANSGELATTAYVAAAVAAATGTTTSLKQAAAVATTADITLSGLQTIDGYTTLANDRVLVKNQTTGSANGIYVAGAGGWARATDVDTAGEISGASVFVQNGTTNGSKTFTCTTSNITLGTTSLTFTDASTIGISAGNGLTLTSGTLDIGTASATRIVVNADNIDLASGVVTAGTYRSVTVDTYGRVTAGTAPTTFSGYGISDTSANLAAALSDETGTGSLVFATTPAFTNGVNIAGSQTTFDMFNNNAGSPLTINAFAGATTVNVGVVTGSQTINIGTGVTAAPFLKTINIGTNGAASSTTNINIGSSSASGTVTISNDLTAAKSLTVTGNLTVNGTTTILNTNTLSVDDKNIEIGAVASTTVTCNVTSGSATVTNLASTKDITVGSAFTNSSGFLGVTVPANTTVASIDSATQLTLSAALTGTGSATNAIAGIGGATDATANLGGITLKGATDKTIIWDSANSNWTSSEHWNIASTKVFKINNVQVLSATALGSNVTGSSLTSVGTISSGTWNGSAVTVGYGGTGLTSAITGLLRGDGSAYNAATAGTHYVVGGTTTVGKLITQASVTTGASLQITAMTAAPSAPVAGDLWNNAGSLRFYNGAEKTIAFTDSTITGNAANVTGTVAIGNGGTGQTTAGAAFNALSPVTTLGDLIYGSGTNTNTRLAGNTTTTRRVLTQTGTGSASAAPVWVDQCNIVSDCTLDGGTF